MDRSLRDLNMGLSRFEVAFEWATAPRPGAAPAAAPLRGPAGAFDSAKDDEGASGKPAGFEVTADTIRAAVARLEGSAAEFVPEVGPAAAGEAEEDCEETDSRRDYDMEHGARDPIRPGTYKMNEGGFDRIEFLIAAGPAEPLRSLAAVASGGEAARVMLALKVAPAQLLVGAAEAAEEEVDLEADRVAASGAASASEPWVSPIVVFDEIDSGVGGRNGPQVGRMIHRLSSGGAGLPAQVLCVTHLPTVAAYADLHVKVEKSTGSDGRIETAFRMLEDTEARRRELTEMAGMGPSGSEGGSGVQYNIPVGQAGGQGAVESSAMGSWGGSGSSSGAAAFEAAGGASRLAVNGSQNSSHAGAGPAAGVATALNLDGQSTGSCDSL